uniref:ATPase family AAA domain containing 5b n=1 Tax=Sinocyclocheilus rhinocerous TaxID=307959 RepID=A0A673KAA3_9TELE
METPFVLPQHTRIKNTSGSVSDRRAFAENLEPDSRPKTHENTKRSENLTGCGNNPSHVTKTIKSSSFCDDILNNCKRKLFTDAAIPTDEKDNSSPLPTSPHLPTEKYEASSNMSLQFVPIPAGRERGSSDKNLKPDIDNFRADKEVLSSCLRKNTSDRDLLMDQSEMAFVLGQQFSTRGPGSTRKSGWGNEFGNEINSELLEEIQILNLQFLVHRFFTLLLRKRTSPEEDISALGRKINMISYCRHIDLCFIVIILLSFIFRSMNKGCVSADKLDFEQFSDGLTHFHAKYRNRLSRRKRRQQQTTFYNIDIPFVYSSDGSWLKEWKIRADTEERRRRQEERRMKKENELWDYGDFEGDTVSVDHEQELCNTVLMIGPSGVDKTAAVYACAQELGFKVFEVNSSVLRCGRLILSQLTEATQSHQLNIQRIKTLISDPPWEKVTSSCKSYHSFSRLSTKPQPVKLTHFFKLSSKKSVGKTSDGPEYYIHAVELKPDRLQRSVSGFKDNRQGDQESTCPSKGPNSVGQSRTVPMSLILFKEVRVIMGMLKPITYYLQCLCVVENMRTDPEQVTFLLCQNKGDIRQSILQLQLWVCSGGGSTELQILKNILKLENSRYLEILAEKINIESLFSPHFSPQSSYQQQPINPKTKGEKSVKGLMLQTSTNVHKVRPDWLSTCRRKKKHLSSCEPKTFSYPHLKLFSLDESCKSSVPSKQTKHLASETDVHGKDEPLMLVFQHMVCTAKFFENMYFLDAYLQRPSLRGTGLCKSEPLGWMGATLKDGLLDLPREEQIGQCFKNSSQILAIVEGLGFHQCQTELSRIWTEAARLRKGLSSERWEKMICVLSLPSDQKNPSECVNVNSKCNEIVSNLISSKKFNCHSSKHVLSMDYLPTLRSICRSERVKEQHFLRYFLLFPTSSLTSKY